MRDREFKVSLGKLDPGSTDPEYWDRFQGRVMRSVAPQLAARRRSRITMGGVVLSWSRLVLPMAAAAAAVAAGFVVRSSSAPVPDDVASVEEIIGVPTDGEEPLPSFLHTDEVVDRDVVLFAVEGF